MIKKFTIIILFIFFIFGIYLIFSNSQFAFNFKKKLPESIKKPIKNFVFFVPIKIREYNQLKNKVDDYEIRLRKTNNTLDAIIAKMNSGNKTKLQINDNLNYIYNLTKINLDHSLDFTLSKMHKKSGYLEILRIR